MNAASLRVSDSGTPRTCGNDIGTASPLSTTRQPPNWIVPHANPLTDGSTTIGRHSASPRIASLEPRNCFKPAPKPNKKRVKRVVRRAEVCEAEAASQKRSESLHLGKDPFAGEVGVKLVEGDVTDRRTKECERSVEPQRRRRPRPAELDEGEVVETNDGESP